jgi:Co/Zn/Cd efflux system component
MALFADGLHMASHASALGLALAAYIYGRRQAHDRRFSFGTGKVNALAGFASAVVLALFALMMAGESVHRFLEPVPIAFTRRSASPFSAIEPSPDSSGNRLFQLPKVL